MSQHLPFMVMGQFRLVRRTCSSQDGEIKLRHSVVYRKPAARDGSKWICDADIIHLSLSKASTSCWRKLQCNTWSIQHCSSI